MRDESERNGGVPREALPVEFLQRPLPTCRIPAQARRNLDGHRAPAGVAEHELDRRADDTRGRVAEGGCPPPAPTDPDVRDSRIRLLVTRLRYMAGAW